MKRSIKSLLTPYHYLLTLAGFALVVFSAVLQPPIPIPLDFGLLVLAFIIFLANFPLRLLDSEITLIQAVTLGVGLLYGPTMATWIIAMGILVGYISRQMWSLARYQRPFSRRPLLLEVGIALGMQLIPLGLSLGMFTWRTETVQTIETIFLGEAAMLALLFALLHSTLFQLDFWLRGQPTTPTLVRDLIALVLVELLPLPFVLLAVAAFSDNQIIALVALGGIPATLAVLMHGVSTTRSDLERRLQDLSTLNNISRTLRSTLDMKSLLSVIHQQVTQHLGVDNFYVALYDLNDQHLWYPLAVKNGQRRDWPRRPLADRLTDRVIRERRPILLARDAQQELARIGLPPSEDAPFAWLGVPLITSEQTIGCLAVFSTSPNVEFDSADLDLLTTLSGQVSVAFENALLYEQAQRRAAQLDTLNRMSSAITASLDPREVLPQICRAVTQVGGGQRSAIFLINPERGEVQLAHAHGLSDDFVNHNRSFPLSQNGRNRCLRTGRPALRADLEQLAQEDDDYESYAREGIRAFGDFPLTTPEGQIGFLSVFFDTPQAFHPEQVELLQTFASQAALAVSNARLYARTDLALSRRAQQLAILENIARELATVIHSERMFEMILDYALEYTNTPWGSLNLYDPERRILEIKAARGYRSGPSNYSDTQGITGRVIRTRQAINVGDVSKDKDYIQLSVGQAASQLSMPLIYEDRVLGVLSLESPDPNAFTTRAQAFVGQLATQAAIAVINSELYSETRRRLREQATLYQVSRRLVGNLNLDRVVQTIAQAVGAFLESLATGVYLLDKADNVYRLRATSQARSETDTHLPRTISESAWGKGQRTSLGTGSLRITQGEGANASRFGVCPDCQVLIFSLSIADQRLGIVLSHIDKDRVVREDDLQLPRAMATQGAIAIQNALLFADVANGHDQMEAVLNSVDDGVLMVNAKGRITLGNAAIQTLMGISLDEMTKQTLPGLPPAALEVLGFTPNQAESLIQNLGQGQGAPSQKITIERPHNQPTKVLERFISPVWGQGRRVIGWVLVVRDISEEYLLNQARELITETLVHDLRSPIGAVGSALRLLEDALPDQESDEVMRQSLDIARRSTKRVNTLIESLLDISRMEAGSIELELTSVDLHALVSDMMVEFMPQANELGILLRNQIPADLPAVWVDGEKIGRVFTNLLDNSLKFTPEGGEVTIQGKSIEEGIITIEISDTGPGIPPEYRLKIFERFSQIPSHRGRRRGSGLGLAFCRLALEAHGGKIWVEPRPGGGSIFTFTLPLKERTAS